MFASGGTTTVSYLQFTTADGSSADYDIRAIGAGTNVGMVFGTKGSATFKFGIAGTNIIELVPNGPNTAINLFDSTGSNGFAVINTAGASAALSRLRSARNVAGPSMSGIITSSSNRSGSKSAAPNEIVTRDNTLTLSNKTMTGIAGSNTFTIDNSGSSIDGGTI